VRTYRVVVIAGDGIGPELTAAALEVLDAVQAARGDFALEIHHVDAGAGHYRQTGRNISEEGLAACAAADAVLKAPVGLPDVRHPDGTEAGLLGGTLRLGLDLYANVRPVRLWPGVQAPLAFGPGQIDYVIVRENTEGLYASRGLGVANDWAASDVLLMTRPGVERIVRFAFELARRRNGAPSDGAHRVTCVDKANVLKSFAFFRRIFDEVAAAYPGVDAEHLHTDAAAQALVLEPTRFDVLVMENFVGDLLSDLGAATVGGWGCARRATSVTGPPTSSRSTAAPPVSPARTWPTRCPRCCPQRCCSTTSARASPPSRSGAPSGAPSSPAPCGSAPAAAPPAAHGPRPTPSRGSCDRLGATGPGGRPGRGAADGSALGPVGGARVRSAWWAQIRPVTAGTLVCRRRSQRDAGGYALARPPSRSLRTCAAAGARTSSRASRPSR
jgi:isocitrate/isopropylmalate dehydrogenase